MTLFQNTVEAYLKADQVFQAEISAAFIAGNLQAQNECRLRRDLNDQAYFLFLFTRFEAEVNASLTNLFSSRCGGHWPDSRSWDLWNQKSRINLMDKVSMLLPHNSPDWQEVKRYYDVRNEIAHGKTWSNTFAVQLIATKMDQLVSRFDVI